MIERITRRTFQEITISLRLKITMKRELIILMAACVPTIVAGQDAPPNPDLSISKESEDVLRAEDTRLLSKVSAELPQEPTTERIEPNFEVEATTEAKHGGHTVRLHRVKQPTFQPFDVPDELTIQEAEALVEQLDFNTENTDEYVPIFVVGSTTFNQEVTRLKWWKNGEEYSAWSSIDFKCFSGFIEFEVAGTRHSALVLHSDQTVDVLPEHPPMDLDGESYQLSHDNPADAEDVPGLFHKLYASDKVSLEERQVALEQRRIAWGEAKEEREAKKRDQEIIIHYWPKKTTNYEHLTKEKE